VEDVHTDSSDEASSKVRIGTSGWSYDDWVGPFYPPGTKAGDYLGSYAERFRTVEVDASFYAVPQLRQFERWAACTPSDFLFTLKIPGTVTHGARGERANPEKVLLDEAGELPTFLERAATLGAKLACVLFQFPYFRVKEFRFEDFLPRLDATLGKLPREIRAAVEIRNKSWLRAEYLECLRAHRAAAVWIDHPYLPPPEEQLALGLLTADFAYVRLLGDRYAIEEETKTWDCVVVDRSSRLEAWARVIRLIASRADTRRILAYANNHYAGHGPATSRDLAERVGIALGGPKADV
jgi:uncharacterized protein YecE (DUF72 family)